MKLLDKLKNKSLKEVEFDIKTKKISKSALVLIIGLAIIAIPIIVFLIIILSASLKTGTPILGDRFKGDLVEEITKKDVSYLEDEIKKISGVEKVEIDYPDTGRLTIMVDVSDSFTKEEVEKKAEEVYAVVIERLPVEKYFTQTETARMYDLSIYTYNKMENTGTNTLIITTKNHDVELPIVQNAYEPVNEEIAKELRGELDTDEPDTDDAGDDAE